MDTSRHSRCLAAYAAYAAVLGALLLSACAGNPAMAPKVADITPQPQADSASASGGQTVNWPAWIKADCTPPAQLDRQPQPRRHTTPFISAHWFPNGLETTVVFRLEVTAQGELGRVAYQPADTDPRIVKSIMRSLERWKFKPGMRQGQPVTSCFEQPYQLVFPRQEIDVPRTPAMNTEPQ
ncbi:MULTISPECIES: energy transducer TonB [Comamonas]|nr:MULTISPECIES: energy transducer TonB [Comamonas]UNV88887.1 energy transducer TonB [Comamonas sp. 7D-2evo1]UNV97813.1 energy transducer TonB [Comamonas sp. 7D-2]UNV98530.1 energy transducer TonB [Comamonas sp. 7D-2evo2]